MDGPSPKVVTTLGGRTFQLRLVSASGGGRQSGSSAVTMLPSIEGVPPSSAVRSRIDDNPTPGVQPPEPSPPSRTITRNRLPMTARRAQARSEPLCRAELGERLHHDAIRPVLACGVP